MTQNRGILVEKAKARTESQFIGRLGEDFPLIRGRLTLTLGDLEQGCKTVPHDCGRLIAKRAPIFYPSLYPLPIM